MSSPQEYLKFINENNLTYLPYSRLWWSKYVYHYTNIDNAIGILVDRCIYSREYCLENNKMKNENASEEIIAQTNSEIKQYVRLYFRPLTPTQYRNEGYRKEEQRYHGTNVPVPIFFAFRSYSVLGMEGTMFSDKSLACSGFQLYSDIEQFKKLDFKRIYHSGPTSLFSQSDQDDIKHKKHAEVIIKDRLDLNHLDNIWCRSNAEYVTLCNLLKEHGIYAEFQDIIGVKEKLNLFHADYLFIDNVGLYDEHIVVQIENSDKGYDVILKCEIISKNLRLLGMQTIISREDTYTFNFNDYTKDLKNDKEYNVKLFFNDCFIYLGRHFYDEKSPF